MSNNYDGFVRYRELEPQYTQAEKRRAEFSEGYKEGYEQAVEKACMDAQEHHWTAETEKIDRTSFERRERTPDFPDFEEIYDEEESEWFLSDDDREWVEDFWDGWNDAHHKHYVQMSEIMKS
jgi:hypothetical protein